MMVLMASTWDILGGQMGYNSLGNITFYGVGMYVSAIVQVAFFYEGGFSELPNTLQLEEASHLNLPHHNITSDYFLGFWLPH